MTDKVIFIPAGTTSFVVPSDWNPAANTVETIDGGGGSWYDPTFTGDNFWRGGDGGTYKKFTNVSWAQGSTKTCVVAAGRVGGAPADHLTGKPTNPTTITGLSSPTTTSLGGAGAFTSSAPHDQGMTGGGAGGKTGAGGNGATATWIGGANGGGSWTSTHNISGGVSVTTAAPGDGGAGTANGANYGGGGGGYDDGPSGGSFQPGNGGPGLIVLTYTPLSAVTGTLAATESPDVFAATGTYGNVGALAATEARDTFAATGLIGLTATLAATEPPDTFAATGSVVNGIGGALATTEAPDTFAAVGNVQDARTSGAGGMGGGVDPWAYHKAVKAARAKRDKVVDLAPPEIIDAVEEARKAAAAEKIRLERRARLETEMRQDAAKEEQRRLIAEAKRARQEIEDRQAEAKRLTDALDPASVAKEQHRQRQVHANHQHAQAMHGQALELAGHFIRHLATTPRKK